MATRVYESCIVSAPAERVWDALRNLDFKWSSLIKSSNGVDGLVGGMRTIHYKDGTEQVVKIMGLDDMQRTVTWDLVESTPSAPCLSATHTLTVNSVTESCEAFVSWTTDFSMDATQEVVQDCKFKRKDQFKELQAMFK